MKIQRTHNAARNVFFGTLVRTMNMIVPFFVSLFPAEAFVRRIEDQKAEGSV